MSISYSTFEEREAGMDDVTASIFRSDVDDRVWMCNIPVVDVATGLQASTSLARLKAYVEEIQARSGIVGRWSKTTDGDEVIWNHREID